VEGAEDRAVGRDILEKLHAVGEGGLGRVDALDGKAVAEGSRYEAGNKDVA
jgi:hypothetical protein